MTDHLTDAELREFVRGVLAPEQLLQADDHLAECDRCRTRAASVAGTAARLDRFELDASSAHLDDEQIQMFVQRRLASAEANAVRRHMDRCPDCAAQVRDLRAWVTASPSRRPRWLAIAAGLVVALLLPASLWQIRSRRDTVPSSLSGIETLPAAEQRRVQTVLAGGAVEPAAFMLDLRRGRETLMGSPIGATTNGSEVIAPVGNATATDKPTFRWTAFAPPAGDRGSTLAGPVTYVVTIADERSNVVARSPRLQATSWTPPEALARGRTYTWQIAAQRGADTFVSPAPPTAPARFHVLDAETSGLIERIERHHPQAYLLLGIVEADSGLRDEAVRHLEQVPSDDRYAGVARRLLEGLKQSDASR